MERATISRQQQTQRAFLGAALMDPARAREYIIKLVPGIRQRGPQRRIGTICKLRITFAMRKNETKQRVFRLISVQK